MKNEPAKNYLNRNLGSVDRIIRLFVGAGAISLAIFVFGISNPFGIALTMTGLILIVTSSIAFCPLYRAFRISSKRNAALNVPATE